MHAGRHAPGGPNPCDAVLNKQYGRINRRGSGGNSNYNSMNVRYDIQDIKHSGLTLRLNYTWSHAFDDLSDTFSSLGKPVQPRLHQCFMPIGRLRERPIR